MQRSSIKQQLFKTQFPTPLFSPRTSFSNHLKQLSLLKTSMIINIDKYILGNLKTEFQKRGKEISMLEFIYFAKKFLKDWNTELYGRDVKVEECLIDVWREIDVQGRGRITWKEFNSKIIETSLNLKSLANNAGLQAPTFRQFTVHLNPGKYQSPIQKIIHLTNKNKMAYFRQQATVIQFFSTQSAQSQSQGQQPSSVTKPLILPQQQLKVETMIKVKQKNQQSRIVEKHAKGMSKIIKKDVKVSSYKNTVLDAIYLDQEKYDMLIVSCSDKYVRGFNISNLVPIVASQPENQDQQMVHQFPFQIYNMAWDSVNEVLYGTGKYPTIYQWMVKTDSEREMFDTRGHQGMVSVLLMMPKLQLLASGGYDGKLLLWDTVSQSVKCRYQQHSRAISSITFHQQLILLFTSALDHKICIWNPYISSLIHKIDNTLNIIHLQIIPNTSYLLALDHGGNVKVREINRFTQIAAFSIFRSQQQSDQLHNNNKLSSTAQKDKEVNISMCSKKDGVIQYYFGTDKIVGYEFGEIDKNNVNNNSSSNNVSAFGEMKYLKNSFKLFTPMKNHIVVWNLLNGRNEETFYDMTENEITAIDISETLGFFIIGDVDGSIIQRRASNGQFIKNLLKMKTAINNIKLYQLQMNQKEKNSHKKTFYLFATTEQGQIAVMKCHPKEEFQMHSQFSLKHDFGVSVGNISTIEYFVSKHVLIVRLVSNEIVTIDVEKRTLLTKIEFGEKLIVGVNFITGLDNDYFLTVLTKSSQLTGFYLPPHNKKFKPSCFPTFENIENIECSMYGPTLNTYFVSTSQNELHSVRLDKRFLEGQNQTIALKTQWKTKLEKRVVSMLLIENEQILILLNQSDDFTFVSTESGEIICHLQQNKSEDKQIIQPILFMKEKTNEIYIPNEQKVIKLFQQQLQQQRIQKIIDPNFFANHLKDKNINNFTKLSNPSWTLNLNLESMMEKRIKEIQMVQDKIKSYEKIFQKRGPTQIQKRLEVALQLQKKWQKQKDKQQQGNQGNDLVRNFNSLQRRSTSKFDPKAFENMMKKNSRGSSLSSLVKHQKLSEFSVHAERRPFENNNEHLIKNKIKKFNEIQQLDASRLQKDPLYRLGLALKSVNTRDQKADNFIQLAKKKEEVRLPKISAQKMKL